MENYVKVNFALIYHQKQLLSEWESMIPWERDIYLGLMVQQIEQENEEIKAQQNKQKSN